MVGRHSSLVGAKGNTVPEQGGGAGGQGRGGAGGAGGRWGHGGWS